MKSIRLSCLAWLLPAWLGLSAHAQSIIAFSNNVPQAIPRRASIIFIECDGLGCGDLSCYGQTNFQTPNLDKLAAEGMRFTNYSAAGSESVSQAALMLGKRPAHLRQRADTVVPLGGRDMTVAQMLERAGYRTALIGEWELGNENSSGAPWRQGFDEFGGYFAPAEAANFYSDYMFRYAPNAVYNQETKQMDTYTGREGIYANQGGQKSQFIPDLLTKAALNFIKINIPDAANRHRPFFLVLNYKIPGDGRSEVPTDAPFSEEKWPEAARIKAAMIARMDGYIGQLRQQLESSGMSNDVAIFFTSATIPVRTAAVSPDYFHSMASAKDTRVPMIAWWPGRIPAGSVSGLQWTAADFLPTAAVIGFAKAPGNIDGHSVLTQLIGKKSPAP